MKTVLDKGNQIPDFQLAAAQWLKSKPDNSHNHGNDNLHKKGLRQTCQLKETVGILRIDFIFISEALFLKFLTGKGSNDPQTGQIFPSILVDLVQRLLLLFRQGTRLDRNIPNYDCQKRH